MTDSEKLAKKIVEKNRKADYVGITAFYAADILLDMNLLQWHFQKQGADEVRNFVIEEMSGPEDLRTTCVRQWASAENLVIESEVRFRKDTEECLWRAVDIFRIAGDRIVEHTQYCSGVWTPEQIARQAAEAPMVRW